MGLTAITGVFSRYFVVGFFLPAYATLVSLWWASSDGFVPSDLSQYKPASQLLILGGVALVTALALSGLSYYVTRLFEGYPLEHNKSRRLVKHIYTGALWLQQRHFDRLVDQRDDEGRKREERGAAALRLDRYFPHERDLLLPTRIGNTLRAFERHSNERWGLDGVTLWPRIELLLSSDEREVLVDAKINFYVFLNSALGGAIVGVALVFDKALNLGDGWSWLLYVLPFVVAWALYRCAIAPAVDWGDGVRSSFDLHRLDLYAKLGVRAPESFSDERHLAREVNRALKYAIPLDDRFWRETVKEES